MQAETKQKLKKKPWVRKRHKVVRDLLYWPLYIYVRLVYRIRIQRLPKDTPQCFILTNHQTAFDQFFVSLSFPQHIYFVSSEDLFSKGWISRLITWLVAPIPFRKSTSDFNGVKNCIHIVREGGSIGMAPEGNRTYSGTTEYMKPSVANLVRATGLPLMLYRIEGGYGAHPRWSDTIRRGKMRSYVTRVIQPEEYKDMTNDALFDVIKKELYVDERRDKTLFYGKKSAEYLDRVMYFCPYCGLSELDSRGDIISCKKCGMQVRYLPDKRLQGVGFDFPYPYVKEWYDAQSDFVRNLDMESFGEDPIYRDTVHYSENIYCKHKIMIDDAAVLTVFKDRFEVNTSEHTDVYPFGKVYSATVLGRNKLNLYVGNQIFQLSGNKHFNPVKYLNLYFHGIGTEKGNNNDEFLGL